MQSVYVHVSTWDASIKHYGREAIWELDVHKKKITNHAWREAPGSLVHLSCTHSFTSRWSLANEHMHLKLSCDVSGLCHLLFPFPQGPSHFRRCGLSAGMFPLQLDFPGVGCEKGADAMKINQHQMVPIRPESTDITQTHCICCQHLHVCLTVSLLSSGWRRQTLTMRPLLP